MAEWFINWPNGLQAGRTVYKLAERLIPRTKGRSCNHFRTCGSLPSTVRVFQQTLTVESNSWNTPLVLRLPSLGNVSARYCWNGSMLIASGSFNIIIHVKAIDQQSLTTLKGFSFSLVLISSPAHVQARFMTALACWPAF